MGLAALLVASSLVVPAAVGIEGSPLDRAAQLTVTQKAAALRSLMDSATRCIARSCTPPTAVSHCSRHVAIDRISVRHAIASDVAVLLARLLEQPAQGGAEAGRVSVLAEPSTNTLLVRATMPDSSIK